MSTPLWAVNTPKPVSPKRHHRLLLIGNLAFVNDARPSVAVGGIYQLSLLPSEIRHGPECGGLGCETLPHLYGHLSASGGASFDRLDYAAFVQAGLIYRLDSTLFTAAGVVAQGAMPWRGLGPVARVEIMHNLGIQFGWLFFDSPHRNDGPFVSVDYLYGLFGDLGLRR
jgi:hypothetical protein